MSILQNNQTNGEERSTWNSKRLRYPPPALRFVGRRRRFVPGAIWGRAATDKHGRTHTPMELGAWQQPPCGTKRRFRKSTGDGGADAPLLAITRLDFWASTAWKPSFGDQRR